MAINCVIINNCLDCPALPPTPAVPAHIEIEPAIGWRGANSIDTLGGDVHVDKISVVPGTTAAYVGLKRDDSPVSIPQMMTHSINFFMAGGFKFFRVVESGIPKTGNVEFNDDDLFEVRRVNSVVVYTRDVGSGPVPFYTSRVSLTGDLYVNACLFMSGDGIQ